MSLLIASKIPLGPGKPPAPVMTRAARRAGTAAVEFAFVAPVMIVLVLGSIEFGRALMSLELLNNAARTGCRRGVISGSSTSDITTAVNAALANAGLPSTKITTSVLVNGNKADASTAVRGDVLTVSLTVPYTSVSWIPAPLFLGSANLQGDVVMRRE